MNQRDTNKADGTDAVEKALGEPVFCEYPDKTWRIRTNLFVVSIVSIGMVLWRLQVEPGSSVFGLKFAGLTDEVVRKALFAVILYLLVHFLWNSVDALLEWRLRVTGTRAAFVTTAKLASSHGDYPDDPRNSTLYSWWHYQATQIGNIVQKAADAEEMLASVEDVVKEKMSAHDKAGTSTATVVSSISEARKAVVDLTNAVKNTQTVLEAARIPASLNRFDNWFEIFLRSQNLRWLIIDFGFPLLIGLFALILLWPR
jgi:hypothetical protein